MTMTSPSRSRRPSVLLLAAVFFLLILGCRDGETAATVNGPSPDALKFRLKTMDGRTLGPSDFAGQVVVVDFWATWCLPCRIQAQILEPLYRDYKGKGVQFLAASVGEDEKTVRAFVKDKPFPYPVLIDPKDELSNKLRIIALPTLLVIDKEGKVTYFQAGVSDAGSLRKILKQAGV
jgi:cytochrome c biogenesis protein CcmG/thiol:disulfide interchange protein DsbE